jgi:hypothetical protein
MCSPVCPQRNLRCRLAQGRNAAAAAAAAPAAAVLGVRWSWLAGSAAHCTCHAHHSTNSEQEATSKHQQQATHPPRCIDDLPIAHIHEVVVALPRFYEVFVPAVQHRGTRQQYMSRGKSREMTHVGSTQAASSG